MKTETFGEYIRSQRIAKKMPLRKLAAALDIDQSTLSKIERNERKLTSASIAKLAIAFNIDYKELKIKFLSEEVIKYLSKEDFSIEVLRVAEEAIKYQKSK